MQRQHTIGAIAQNTPRVLDIIISRYLKNPTHFLPILLIFITDRCNLTCRMCGVWERHSQHGEAPELSTREWKSVIASAAALKTRLLSIAGGEPFMREDLFEIAGYAREKEIAVHLCSNGTMLDRDTVKRLAKSGVQSLSLSLESTDAGIHDVLRGKGTFEKVSRGIELVRSEAPRVRIGINYLITPKNFRKMHEMIPFAEKLGVHQIKFAPIHMNLQHKSKQWDKYRYLIFGEGDVHELEAELAKLMERARRSRLRTTSRAFLAGIPSLYRKRKRFRCFAGYAACAINPTGMVAPCCDMESSLSVRERPLEEIWRSEAFGTLREHVHHCRRPCWDTTNTELSLRLRLSSLLPQARETWRDLEFYFGNHTT